MPVTLFEDSLRNLGPFSKAFFGLSIILTVATTLGYLDGNAVSLDFQAISRLELWRLVTSLVFFGPASIWACVNFGLFCYFHSGIEATSHPNRQRPLPADHLWFLLLVGGTIFLASFALQITFPSLAFLASVAWVWCRMNSEENVTLLLIPVPARFFSAGLLVIHLCLGFGFVHDLIGIAAGHLFLFGVYVLPTRGINFLGTPGLLHTLLPADAFGTSFKGSGRTLAK
eukprot:TRINITY_DN6493_c0_g1_i1.p1 TRINITY_DN6493_c0_g1~~TRINITY_DN6493_c0_g1_i1.p1  ORF type:complete len:228 (-),score=24.89 TRINITY_DN6493_c0_g1_i1:26-709(-)